VKVCCEFARLTDDPLGGLIRVNWLYEWQELRQGFGQAVQRNVSELTRHGVHSLFHFIYVNCNGDRLQHGASLAELVGYHNSS
jgi:hypothetical protein